MRDVQPIGIFDRSVIFLGHADRISWHVVHEEIGEMLGRYNDDSIGPRGVQRLA